MTIPTVVIGKAAMSQAATLIGTSRRDMKTGASGMAKSLIDPNWRCDATRSR